MADPVPWRDAWQDALYGPSGFYRDPGGPAGHFRTATHAGPGRELARTLWSWADRFGLDGIVDVGAGRGELLHHLAALRPDRPLLGLDVVARPAGLPAGVGWVTSPGGARLPSGWRARDALVVAHEWLDVVPCTVAAVAADGSLREVLVDVRTGAESTDGLLDETDSAWCERFWPSVTGADAAPGDRLEVGRARDEAWSALLDRLDGGVAVAVDYGHTAADRPRTGSLRAYRSGRLVDPVPDGTCDLTAHVAVDSLPQTRRLRQREAVEAAGPVDHDLARRDPAGYLHGLAARSDVAALRSEGGFGDFWWVLAEP